MENYKRSITWCTEDIAYQAECRWNFFQQLPDHPYHGTKSWEDLYDEKKFKDVLDRMIDKHDATLGVCWDTIDIYLDDMALKI